MLTLPQLAIAEHLALLCYGLSSGMVAKVLKPKTQKPKGVKKALLKRQKHHFRKTINKHFRNFFSQNQRKTKKQKWDKKLI